MSTPDLELRGQTALVTGATTGLGRAIALQLAASGTQVLVHGRDTKRAEEIVSEITRAGGSARHLPAELSDTAQTAHLIEAAGPIDILVNNAGRSLWGPSETLGLDAFDAMYFLNVRAPFQLVAGFAPGMAARGSGSIINVGSMAGTIGLAGAAAYGATKAALASLTRAWALEYGTRNVRVNAVAPGPIFTRPEARERFDALGATVPLNRAAQPEEIAAVVTFLASARSSYVTGAILAADGGRTAI
ncbi:SDR family oxidoreductase [Streptomyces sp. S.PB5]|uniref:SDR family NAD(P)-dependent oxidoreductase n=1 Tax=Streptomyces sp. S.PB5 TaxID=3020844 RepID=UPI0025B185FB|nr:SDR family oxidoreductase [Streptomyces sp. S.PB5]MDN3028346.1 SDR family oxidoreductase [Streptomyces sp. S.PB5]